MTPARFLTADLGNSALKLVVWERAAAAHEARALERARFPLDSELVPALTDWLAGRPAPAGAALSSVASPERTAQVVERLAARAPLAAPPVWGGRTECREPARVGQDRLLAARGAWERVRGPVLVADAGSALNVEAVVTDPARAAPLHLGGAIAPGPRLLAAALAGNTARLPQVEPRADAPALGRDSSEALAAGLAVGFAGAAARLVAELAREAGLGGAPLVLTGGARRYLLVPGLFPGREVLVRPDLVHEGLLAAGGDELFAAAWRAAEAT